MDRLTADIGTQVTLRVHRVERMRVGQSTVLYEVYRESGHSEDSPREFVVMSREVFEQMVEQRRISAP